MKEFDYKEQLIKVVERIKNQAYKNYMRTNDENEQTTWKNIYDKLDDMNLEAKTTEKLEKIINDYKFTLVCF